MAEPNQTQTTISVEVSEGNSELTHISDVRKRFNTVELYEKINKKKDILNLSRKLNIKPRILNLAVCEGRVKKMAPQIQHSKADILSQLKTDREIKLFLKDNDINTISPRNLRRMIRKWKNEIQDR